MELSITLEGEQLLSRRLTGLATDLTDLQPAFADAGNMLTEFFSGEVFDTEGSVIGRAWQPLAESTLKEKLRLGYPETPLTRTGHMRESFVSVASPNMAVITNEAPYFVYHQSSQPRGSQLPRRVMMALDAQRKEGVIKIFQAYIQSLMKKAV